MGLAVFLILFILMGSANATNDNITALSEDTDNDIIQEKISDGTNDFSLKEIESKENHENTTLKASVGGDTFADIQTAIDSAASGDTLNLDGLYKGSGTPITIDKNNLTIVGNNAILDAQGHSRIFNITGAGIILKNITLINGNSTDEGGAIYWYGVDGTINNCNFSNNKATLRGGAIYWYGANATIDNSNFMNNTAAKYSGGAIQWDANSTNGTVNNCNFSSNTGTQRGGAIYWQGKNGTINRSIFINNTSINGGAINWGMDVLNGAVNNSIFINNTGNDGGAVYWEGRNGKVNNCDFISNTGENGGAINWQKTYGQVNNCNFTDNIARENGGAIYWEGSNGTETNCNFKDNTATNGGAIYWYAYNGTVMNSNFTNNTAESAGGAINWQGTNGTISDSIFKDNKAGNYSNIYGSEDLLLFNSTLETSVTINQLPDSYEGNSATVNFTFDDGTNLGGYNVTLYNNNQIIKTFKYEGVNYYNYTWDKLALGNYSITVDEINTKGNKYIASCEPMNFKVISKYSTSVVINPVANVTYGSEVVIDFTVENRTDINVVITNVQTGETKTFYNFTGSEFRINNLVSGKYNVTIINCENEMYNSSNASALFSVAKIFIKDNKDMSVFYREGAIFKVRIVDENGNPVGGKSVKFKVNGATHTAVSDAKGYASCNINWKPGKSTISTVCGDSTVSNTIKVKSVIHAAKNVKVKKSNRNTKFKIALYGLKVKIVKKVSFKFNGKTKIPVKIGTDLAGKTVSVKLKGKYFTAKVDSKGKGVLKISKKLARELKLKKSKTYKASATYENKLIYKNKPVKVKIGAKKYSIKTNKKGEAVFKITKKMVKKLKIGKKYSYHIEFGEDTAKGNLIIKK